MRSSSIRHGGEKCVSNSALVIHNSISDEGEIYCSCTLENLASKVQPKQDFMGKNV